VQKGHLQGAAGQHDCRLCHARAGVLCVRGLRDDRERGFDLGARRLSVHPRARRARAQRLRVHPVPAARTRRAPTKTCARRAPRTPPCCKSGPSTRRSACRSRGTTRSEVRCWRARPARTPTTQTPPRASCPLGTFKAEPGAAACTSCPDSSASAAASHAAGDCACNAGYTGPHDGPCTLCAAGEYKAEPGAAACSSCAENSDSAPGSDAAEDCLCVAGYEFIAYAEGAPVCAAGLKLDYSLHMEESTKV